MNHDSNFLGGSFSNRDNVRAPIKFRRESQGSNFNGDNLSNRDNEIDPIEFRRESQPQHLEK